MKILCSLMFQLFWVSSLFAEASWFTPADAPKEPQNVYWRPLVSLLLPGFDQYAQGHYTSGLLYSSAWIGANVWYQDRLERLEDDQDAMQWDLWSERQQDDYRNHRELPRQATLAGQYITAVGAMSAWHSFRSAVETQKPLGRYEFLQTEETPMDLLAAPFQFSHLQRSTTWAPLLIAAGLGALSSQALPEDYQRDPYTSSDAAYASVLSYNAGVSEEALFRGYLQPLLYESWRSPFWANAVQATVFGLAHRSTIERPFAQIGMGYYLGWLQQRRGWTLSESIFVHTWWDVIVLSSAYLVRLKDDKRGPPPVLWLPAVSWLW
ncbi:MAG TPA: CPBP family intramembrane glutamic endopeptidase [Oligoflexus sp.]|uniref:CPBP family intramembrane glutamic endopeptidase n=1 Tax=Oligoflexus sp. TaxID=1971216 RepID=UPI002D357BA5|nr:CPBP family intramembrane glutamic endopeptidase [Oligoflexus sp.]HYX31634.1 CPBP family intramembrane glutamic endopeptidase [Oligoflexus sp.]